MKFTDGYWQSRHGVTLLRPAEVRDLEVGDDGRTLTAYAPTARIHTRGDTLNRPLLTVEFSSPMPDVIRVRLARHLGAGPRHPQFAVDGTAETRCPAVPLNVSPPFWPGVVREAVTGVPSVAIGPVTSFTV